MSELKYKLKQYFIPPEPAEWDAWKGSTFVPGECHRDCVL